MKYNNDYETRNNTLNLDLNKTIWRLTVEDILSVMEDNNILEELDDDDINFVIKNIEKYFNIDNWAEIVSCHVDDALYYRKKEIEKLNENLRGRFADDK
jgi:hypothetical protein